MIVQEQMKNYCEWTVDMLLGSVLFGSHVMRLVVHQQQSSIDAHDEMIFVVAHARSIMRMAEIPV